MNLVIPFESTQQFEDNVYEIKSISLEHEITQNDFELLGNFYVSGTYKEYEYSTIEKDFKFIIPFSVSIPDNIKKDTLEFNIDNFTYELIDNAINIKIDYVLEAQENKEEKDISLKEERQLPYEENIINSISTFEEYITYHIHTVNSIDTIDSICIKYKVDKDDILKINNISEINENDKLLIPITNE